MLPKSSRLNSLLKMSEDKRVSQVKAGSRHRNRTTEIKPGNQTRKTKLNWKHTLGKLKSQDKKMCVWEITSAG